MMEYEWALQEIADMYGALAADAPRRVIDELNTAQERLEQFMRRQEHEHTALLAEVERLRALEEENAQLRALLSDAYDSWFYGDEASYSSPPWVDRAMALLGKAR